MLKKIKTDKHYWFYFDCCNHEKIIGLDAVNYSFLALYNRQLLKHRINKVHWSLQLGKLFISIAPNTFFFIINHVPCSHVGAVRVHSNTPVQTGCLFHIQSLCLFILKQQFFEKRANFRLIPIFCKFFVCEQIFLQIFWKDSNPRYWSWPWS